MFALLLLSPFLQNERYVRYVHGDVNAVLRGTVDKPIEMFALGARHAKATTQHYFTVHKTKTAAIASLITGDTSYIVTKGKQRYTLNLAQARKMSKDVGNNSIKLKYCLVSRNQGDYLIALPSKREWPSGLYAYEGTFRWNPERRTLKFLGYGAPYGEIGKSARPALIRYEYPDGWSRRLGMSVVLPDRVVPVVVPKEIDGHKATILWAVLSPDRAALVVDAGPPRLILSIDELGRQHQEK
jgi:hypothetical protein